MKNKKIIISLWCMLLISLVISIIVLILPQKDFNYKIYKEECWNETDYEWIWDLRSKSVTITFSKSELVYMNKELLFYRFLEKAKTEQNFTEGYIGCMEDNNQYYIISENETSVIYGINNYGIPKINNELRMKNCRKTNVQKCEKKLVEEICWVRFGDNTIILTDNLKDKECNKKRSIDITQDWLDENCLVYWCDLENNCRGEYKCGEYEVIKE